MKPPDNARMEIDQLAPLIAACAAGRRDSLRVQRVPRDDKISCSFIWMEGQQEAARRVVGEAASRAERIEIAPEPGGLLASRGGVWLLARLDPQSPVCR